MGKTTEKLQKWVDQGDTGAEYLLSLLRNIVGFLVSPPSSTVGKALTMYDQLSGVVKEATKIEGARTAGPGCHDILVWYLETANRIGDDTAAAVEGLIDHKDNGFAVMRDKFIGPPKWT